jgi:threonine dehydrogenase-like Zn-dependent dehydrogenase
MRELAFVKSRTLQWRDAPEPVLTSATDALVRPFVAARCDGDAVFLRHDFERLLSVGAMMHVVDEAFRGPRTNPFAGPFAYGHECVAEVTACGTDVRRFAVGDVAIVPWAISCGQCSPCSAGLTSKCARACGEKPLAAFGFGDAIGGHGGMVSDALRVPWADAMLVRVPAGLDPLALASASDNLPDGYRTVGPYLERMPGAPVLVVGGGAKSIGLYAAGIAKALGSSHVDYVDTSKTRLDLAERMGAHPIPLVKNAAWYREGKPTLREGYPITVDASSTTAGLAYAISALAPGGTCTGVGFYLRRGTPLPLWKMYMKSATLRLGVSHPSADLPALLPLLESRLFDPATVNTLVADWNDAPRALLERSTKVVIRRNPLGQGATSARFVVAPGYQRHTDG